MEQVNHDKTLDQSDDNLPVVFASGRQQYPSKKLDVSQYKNDVSEILEETFEMKQKQDNVKQAQQNKQRPVAKIKQFLSPVQKKDEQKNISKGVRLSYQIVSIKS